MNRIMTAALVLTIGWLAAGANASDDEGKNGKGQKVRGDKQAIAEAGPAGGHAAGRMQGGGGGGGGNFDPASFSSTMIQQFDENGDGELNQSELANCLGMLHQQVLQQQQSLMQNSQRQSRDQMASGGNGSNGQPGGFGPHGANQMNNSDSSFSSMQAMSRGSSNGGSGTSVKMNRSGPGAGGGAGGRGGGAGGGAGGRGGSR